MKRRKCFLPIPIGSTTTEGLILDDNQRNNEQKFSSKSTMTRNYEVWTNFAETTSCHGVREISQSKNIFWKVFWSISVLLHLAFLLFGLWSVVSDYLEAPTVTKVSLTSVPNLPLPDVAFCNTNGLNRTAMSLDGIPESVQWQLRDLGKSQFRPSIASALHSRNLSLEQFLIKYSYKCDELLYGGCSSIGNTVRGRCCEDSTVFIHRYFGVCYLLEGRNQTAPGISNGWKMNFNMPETAEITENETEMSRRYSFDAISFADGLALEIGYKYQHLNQNPILMSKNQVVSVRIRPEQHLRLDESCLKNMNLNRSFTSSSCFFWCSAKAYKEVCGCGIFGYAEAFFPTLKLCEFDDYRCLTTKEVQITEITATCRSKCKPVCEDFIYKPSVTYSDLILKPYGINLRVQLGYSDLEYALVEEVRSYTLFMAISSLGGQAGLWMGCSILTLIHAVTYCGWAVTLCCSKKVETVVKRVSVPNNLHNEIRQKQRNYSSNEEIRV